MKNNYLVTTILVIVFAGTGFYGGIQYQKSQRVNFAGQLSNRQGTMKNNRGGFWPVLGEIISADDKSITVKLQDDSSKIVLINAKTVINKVQTDNKSELKVWEKVSVFGSKNTDGNVTTQNIQFNPTQKIKGTEK